MTYNINPSFQDRINEIKSVRPTARTMILSDLIADLLISGVNREQIYDIISIDEIKIFTYEAYLIFFKDFSNKQLNPELEDIWDLIDKRKPSAQINKQLQQVSIKDEQYRIMINFFLAMYYRLEHHGISL